MFKFYIEYKELTKTSPFFKWVKCQWNDDSPMGFDNYSLAYHTMIDLFPLMHSKSEVRIVDASGSPITNK